MAKHRNTFESGMIQDRPDVMAPPNSYYSALNAVHESEHSTNIGLVNEQSTKLSVDVGGTILGTTYIEQIKKSIIFVDKDGSSIYLFDHVTDNLEFIMSDSEFGCSWGFDTCEFMYAEVKEHNACDDIYIYFSSDCTYYVVNITEMLDPVRKNIVLSTEECSYFELVHKICTPVINATPIQYSGSTLESGAVAFAVRLTDYDANYSNWFPISGTTIITSENNQPGERANSAVKVTFGGLDPRYEYIEVAVIKTGGGVTTVTQLEKMAYSGGTYGFTYYGQKGYPMDIAQITTQTKVYLQGKDLIQHDGRLFFYNIKREKNLNYQKYANNIGVTGSVHPVSLKQQVKYRFPSLQRGECYRFGIVWNYADGTHSKAFAILGDADGGDKSSRSEPHIYEQPTVDYDTADHYVVKTPAVNQGVENSALEDAILSDIENIDTGEKSLWDAASQLDRGNNPYCCDDTGTPVSDPNTPTTATESIQNDVEDVSNMFQNIFESLSEAAKDKELKDFELNKTLSLKEAATELYNELVKNKDYTELKAPTLNISGGSERDAPPADKGNGRYRADNWVDINGRQITDEEIRSGVIISFEKKYNQLQFPNFYDCQGERMFPQGNLFCYKVPEASDFPHYDVNNAGVLTNYQPSNDPYSDVVIWLMGARFSNIHIPTDDELPKPLCPTTPYSIVYVKRDDDNSSVIASGWTGGTEFGYNGPDGYNFQRHGVNSRDNVFRGVNENGSRKTQAGRSFAVYTFHSPDTDFAEGRLDATKIRSQLKLRGTSWRHGLYAKGNEPMDNWTGQRVDQRGARIGNNLVGTISSNRGEYTVKGISPSKNGTVTSPAGEMRYPVDNVFNESSVCFEVDRIIPGNERDTSFIGDTLDHQGNGNCNSAYVSLLRDLPTQYGGIENSAYIQLGVRGGWVDGQVVTATEGICGDVFIGPYSKRRTSFVSEKVGDGWNVRSRAGNSFRPRSVCDQPDRLIYEILGLNINQTDFPDSGDITDPRNYSGLYTTNGLGSIPLTHSEALAESGPIQDYYFPGTVTGVVYSIVEAKVCAWERSTGSPELDQIYADELKGFNLDSAVSEIRPWENCYLNNVNYVPVFQPSRKQLSLIALIRNVVMLLIPASALATIVDIEGVFDAVGAMFASTGLAALFMTAAHTLFTTDGLRRLFGIEPCYTDKEGASRYFKSERHKDNYNRYNWDFSKITTETQYLGINSLYNTCVCDSCITDDIDQRGGQTNKEIYFSAKQNLDTEIDAYRNIRIGAYNEMPVHAGNIRKMFLQNNNMYVHSTKGIWMIQMAAGNWPADIGSQLTGTGDLLMRPILMLDTGMGEGFAGTNHPNASINVPGHGYFFIDDVSRKVYKFDGNPEDISGYGMRKFFNQHLGFCESGDCHDEINAPKYAMGWDYKYNRLLLTKQDQDPDASFTLSFTPYGQQGRWISFHSYIPDFYFRDRYNMYSVVGGEIHKHNVKDSYQEFYGEKYPHFIQFTMVDESSGLKYFDLTNIKISGQARRGQFKMLDATFNKAFFWNYKDASGPLTLRLVSDLQKDNKSQLEMAGENSDYTNIIRKFDMFTINDIRNNFNLLCDEFVNNKENIECAPIEDIEHSTECLTFRKQRYDKRNFGGRYINSRLVYNNVTDTELSTYFIEWEDADELESKL